MLRGSISFWRCCKQAEIALWYLRKACAEKQYRATPVDVAMLETLSEIKRNGGEAPAHIRKMMSEVIPSQAEPGRRNASVEGSEGVTTTRVRSTNNPAHERPATLN